MSAVNNGGLAFPFVSNGYAHEHQYCEPGMSLRAYAAVSAMQGLLASGVQYRGVTMTAEMVASYSVAHADALIKALGGEG